MMLTRPDGWHEGPPVAYGACSRLSPLGAYGGPTSYEVVEPAKWKGPVLERDIKDDRITLLSRLWLHASK